MRSLLATMACSMIGGVSLCEVLALDDGIEICRILVYFLKTRLVLSSDDRHECRMSCIMRPHMADVMNRQLAFRGPHIVFARYA